MFIDQICIFCCNFTLDIFSNWLFQKKSKYVGQGLRTSNFHSRERTSKNPRVHLKKKCNFWGFKKKLMWNFLGSWFWPWNFQGVAHKYFVEFLISRGKRLFSPEFPKVNDKSKNPRGFSEKYIHQQTPKCLDFFWNSPMDRWLSSKKSNYYFSSMATGSIPEKNPNRGRVEDLKFLGGILKKYNVEIPEVN